MLCSPPYRSLSTSVSWLLSVLVHSCLFGLKLASGICIYTRVLALSAFLYFYIASHRGSGKQTRIGPAFLSWHSPDNICPVATCACHQANLRLWHTMLRGQSLCSRSHNGNTIIFAQPQQKGFLLENFQKLLLHCH